MTTPRYSPSVAALSIAGSDVASTSNPLAAPISVSAAVASTTGSSCSPGAPWNTSTRTDVVPAAVATGAAARAPALTAAVVGAVAPVWAAAGTTAALATSATPVRPTVRARRAPGRERPLAGEVDRLVSTLATPSSSVRRSRSGREPIVAAPRGARCGAAVVRQCPAWPERSTTAGPVPPATAPVVVVAPPVVVPDGAVVCPAWPWNRSIDSCAPGGIEPSALRTRKIPAMPPSEWNWTWQWYIHAPGPTPRPATTWNPNASPGLRSRLSTTWLGSYWSARSP